MAQEEKIKLSDKTTVYLTEAAYSVKNGSRTVGTPVQMHPKQAERAIADGKATEKAPTATKEKGGRA